MTLPPTPQIQLAPSQILYLCQDLPRLQAQLAGQPLRRAEAGPLRDDISTDEITPVAILSHYDDRLGDYAHTGLQVQGQCPIAPGALRQRGVRVLVGGRRYGKGSSREHSPTAEQLAGVQLVFAESFERIYRQNADNIGLITCTDLSLLDRLTAGEALPLDLLLQGREALAAAILAQGGLLGFGRAHLQGARPSRPAAPTGPQTLFEKIIARHLLHTPVSGHTLEPGTGVFVQADWRFIHEYYTGMAAHLLQRHLGPVPLHQPERVVVFEDHTAYVEESPVHQRLQLISQVQAMCRAQRQFAAAHGLREHRTLTEAEAASDISGAMAGISHAMMAEHYALPGQVVVGTDSHTPHSGALGCVAFGVGTTDMANALVTGAVRLTLPESVQVQLNGPLPPGLTAKDVMLHLLALPFIREGGGVGKVFEFTGDVVTALGTDERATLTNMTAELGGLTGLVAPDAETRRFLRERRGWDAPLPPDLHSDPGAHYAQVLTVDCRHLSPMVAAPGDPGRGQPVDNLAAPVPITIAYGGSCTAGKREDFEHYHAVLAWGLAQGLRVPPQVQLYLQYGTTAVRDHCRQKGYEATFLDAGARLLQPSCGACANCGPGSSTQADQVTVSAINRNFPGRSGPGQVWLASPPTVMASALAGRLVSWAQLQAEVATLKALAP